MSSEFVGTVCGVVAASYLCYLAHVAIHICVHTKMFKSRRLNFLAGGVLGSTQLLHFEGWRIAHLRHHRAPNTAVDPHRIDRPMLRYVLGHYFRIARAVWDSRRFLIAVAPPALLAAAIVIWQMAAGEGWRGLRWVLLFWLVPVAVGHMLIAHFNYITHVGLPAGRGRDTRSFHKGLWKLANVLTFNVYLHAEHHLKPNMPIPRLQGVQGVLAGSRAAT